MLKTKLSEKKIFLLIFLGLILFRLIEAQVAQTGAIRGVVRDKDGNPLPGVEVTATSPSLLGVISSITNISGEYKLLYLPPGIYSLTAKLEGFQTIKREGILVRVGMTITVNFDLQEETFKHEVTVVAASPAVDVVATKGAVNITSEFVERLPISRTDVNNLINLAPGATNLSIKGGARNNHAFVVDGINDNAPNQNYGEVYISWDTIEEAEVITDQAGVEQFQGIGGAINIVTKSGGNNFSGQIQAYYTDRHLSYSVVPHEKLLAVGSSLPQVPKIDYDTSFTLGGPIIKDKIWFLANYRYQYYKRTSTFIPTTILGKKFESYDLEQSYRYYFLKLSALPWRNFRIFGMATIPRRNTPIFDDVSRRTVEANRRQILDQRTTSFNAIWTINPNTFIEFIAGNWWNNGQNMDTKYANSEGPYFVDKYTGYEWGRGSNNQSFYGFKRNYYAGAKLTNFRDNFFGSEHQIKAGAELQIGSMRSFQPLKNGMEWDFYNENPYYYRGLYGLNQAHPEFGDGLLLFSNAPPREAITKTINSAYCVKRRIGMFVQDSINIKRKFNITLGLRFDYINNFVPEISKTEAADALGKALGDVYIKPIYGVNPFAGGFKWTRFDNPFPYKYVTPFVGFSYDISGSGKTAFKLSYYRPPEGLMTDNIPQPPVAPQQFQFRWWDKNGNGYPDFPGIDDYKFVLGATSPTYMLGEAYKDKIDPNIKIPYEHQLLVGLTHELFSDFGVSLNYTFKTRRNEWVYLYYDRVAGKYWSFEESYFVPFKTVVPSYGIFPEKEVTVYFRKSDHPELFLRATTLPNEKLRHRYHAFELSLNKRMSHGWALGGSFVYTYLKGTVEYSGGYIQTAFHDPNYSINRYGDLAFSIPIIIKLFGVFNLPYDFWLSFFYQYIDGNGWARTVTIEAPQSWRLANNIDPSYTSVNILLEPRGTRRNQSSHNLDLRLEKQFNLSEKYGNLRLFIDIFNALGYHSFDASVDPAGFWRPVAENSKEGTFTPSRMGFNRITGGVMTFKFSVNYSFNFFKQ